MSTELINCHPRQELDHHLFDEHQVLVHRIIDQENVYSVFQPIVHLNDGSILGYEALLRGPERTCFHAPIPLFQAAEAVGRLFELECIARKKAIQRFIELDLPGKLFLNMSPMSLQDPNFQSGQTLALIDSFGFSPQRIVIEITEHHPVQDYQLLIKAVEHYRSMGFTIALDDLGEGHSSLRLWSELRPDYVKLDKHFVTHLEATGKHKLQFVKIITELAQSVETRQTQKMNASLERQTKGIMDVSRSIDEIDASTQQNAAMVEQIASTSENIINEVLLLEQHVQQFNLPNPSQEQANIPLLTTLH